MYTILYLLSSESRQDECGYLLEREMDVIITYGTFFFHFYHEIK